MAASDTVERYARHVDPAFVKLLGVFGYGRVFTRARDVWIWDHADRRYLDLLAGFGAVNLGHNHPRLIARLTAFLQEDALAFAHVGPSPQVADLAEALVARTPAGLDLCNFANSGAEAVEEALKLARLATGRGGVVFCAGAFHGTSFGTLSVAGAARLRGAFGKLLPDCVEVPFGDLDLLRRALARGDVAAFLVEPILGEGGVVLPPAGYLREARALCEQYGALLIQDEVQTGLGRTGARFAFEAEDVVPDVLVLAKGLSGGIAPISALITRPELHQRAYGRMDRFDLHGSTFAGNALCCVAARETLQILDDERLAENAAARGAQLVDGLRRRLWGHPLVRDVRGRGLLVAVELGPTRDTGLRKLLAGVDRAVSQRIFGQWAALKLLEAGFICQPASQAWNVLKIEPPLTIGEAEIDSAIDAIAGVLGDHRSAGRIVLEATRRIGAQLGRGWRFR